MQILHPFSGSIQQYGEEIADLDRYRPDHCPQCEAKCRLTGHGFYRRTLVEVGFDGSIRVRRYLCRGCKRTVSLLPEFALPYLRFSISLISLFLIARLLEGRTLQASAAAASQPGMPYQRGQFWIRRFQKQAADLCGALAAKITPLPAASFVLRALQMLQSLGWVMAHRFLFSELRYHLLGWPPSLFLTVVRPRSVRFSRPPERSHTALVLRGILFPHSFGFTERFPWMPKLKKSPCFVMASLPRWFWSRCRAASSAAAPRRLPPATMTSPLPSAPRFRSTRCWTGRSATGTVALKPWPPSRARTAGNPAPSRRSSPI